VRAARDGGQRVGVVPRRLRPRLLPELTSKGPARAPAHRGPVRRTVAHDARRLLPVPRLVLLPVPGGGTLGQHRAVRDGEPGVPLRPGRLTWGDRAVTS